VAHTAAACASNGRAADREAIEDLTQDALLKLCRNNFAILREVIDKPDAVIEAFVKVTVGNLIRDEFRKERSLRRRPPAGLVSDADLLGQFVDERPAANIERSVLIREIDEILQRHLTGPNAARDRRVFWLFYRHELTAKAIAAVPTIGLTDKGVESALLRLKILVKEELTEAKGIVAEGTSL
jgi:RNA polymerase sigma-70 factor (ECF subfamily)